MQLLFSSFTLIYFSPYTKHISLLNIDVVFIHTQQQYQRRLPTQSDLQPTSHPLSSKAQPIQHFYRNPSTNHLRSQTERGIDHRHCFLLSDNNELTHSGLIHQMKNNIPSKINSISESGISFRLLNIPLESNSTRESGLARNWNHTPQRNTQLATHHPQPTRTSFL